MIGVEANLADIEVLRPVDVSYRDGDEFDLPVHVRQLTRLSSLAVSRYIGQNPTADDYVVIGGAGPVLAHLLAGKLRGGTAPVMGLWRRIEAAGATRLNPTDPDPSAAADGKGLRVVSPKLADALIALAVAVFGAVGTLAAAHQGGEAPVAAAAIGRNGAEPLPAAA